MSNLIRTDYQLGNQKVVVGNITQDLVLETLGQIYIKSGKNLKLLQDITDTISSSSSSKTNIIFVNNSQEQDQILTSQKYPGDGAFVFNTITNILYLTVNYKLIPLVDADLADPTKQVYVQKNGDTMTGQLEIVVRDLSPLIVRSNKLVKNFNANYIEGYSSEKIAIKAKNEFIQGNWTYNGIGTALNKWVFKDTVTHNKDIITSASIGTPYFFPGFSGSGWRLDGETNTLTIDNLVVRKLMKVYEMVINKIRATNGSLWVTDSDKCKGSSQLIFITEEQMSSLNLTNFPEDSYIVFPYYYDKQQNKVQNVQLSEIGGDCLMTNQNNGEDTNFVGFSRLYHIKKPASIVPLVQPILEQLSEDTGNTSIIKTVSDYVVWEYPKRPIEEDYEDTDEEVRQQNWIDQLKEYYECVNLIDFQKDILNISSYMLVVLDEHSEYPVQTMYTYYKYFGCKENQNNYHLIKTESDYPVFRAGDIVRCQKMIDTKEIKYYDAVVYCAFDRNTYLIQVAQSVLDQLTSIQYDEEGNLIATNKQNSTPYTKGIQANDVVFNTETQQYEYVPRSVLGQIQEGDELVRVGNLQDTNRQGAVYITSSDDQSPYIDVLSDLNRPDYSVLYKQPILITYKQWKYVGTVNEFGSTYLGKFIIDEDTNNIKESESSEGTDLYGYDQYYDHCLVLLKKEQIGEEDGQPIYAKETVYDYTKTVRARLGKLDGIYDYRLGDHQPYGYGLYSDNVFLTGEFYLNNGKSIASFADDIALLSGQIEGIDIDQLKIDVAASVEDIIENKFKSTINDGEGNKIPSGFAGLFTFDYTDSTMDSIGGGALDGKKGLAVLGDSIVFYTSKDGQFDFGKPTALIRDKKINAELIDVKELEFDKLVGKSTIDSYEHVITVTYSYDQNTYENVKITGLVGLDYSRPVIGTLSNTLYGGILTLRDFNTEKGHNIKLKEINVDGVFTYDYEVSNRILANVSEVPLGDYISELDANGGEDVSISEIKKNTIEEYTITTINGKSKGESVIYYPDGSVLNAKIISTDTSGKVTGCVEYFFAQGKIRIDTLLDKGDEYIVQNFMEGEVQQEQYKGGLLKRINYFDFADSFVINWVQYYDRYDTKDEWIALFEDLYMNTGIQLNELEEMYDHMVKLDTAAKNGNGKYQSDYSNFVAAVLSSLHGTQGSGKIGKGSGYGSIQSGDKIFFPSGKWYSYDSQLEQKINNSIRNNGNYYDDIKNKNIIEGLYITHYELKDPGTTEGEHNSGNFNILYFNSEKSIEGKITFTIENGNYNGGAGMSPIK